MFISAWLNFDGMELTYRQKLTGVFYFFFDEKNTLYFSHFIQIIISIKLKGYYVSTEANECSFFENIVTALIKST